MHAFVLLAEHPSQDSCASLEAALCRTPLAQLNSDDKQVYFGDRQVDNIALSFQRIALLRRPQAPVIKRLQA